MPDYSEWLDMVNYFDMTVPEQKGWLEACKEQAFVTEKVAKHENKEVNLAVARYFWRRVEKLNSYIKRLEADLDAAASSPKPS